MIRIKAAKNVEVFADELVSRFAIRGAKRRRTDRHHDATSGPKSSSIYYYSQRNAKLAKPYFFVPGWCLAAKSAVRLAES